MKNITWDAWQLFIDVARSGGLTGASATTGLSPATIGRRMLDLEEKTGKSLFLRSQTGYLLTPDGRMLLEHLLDMEAAARKVDGWQQGSTGNAVVRIAAGTWIAWLLSRQFAALRQPQDQFRIDLLVAEQRASLAHRENDIGIRAFEPQEANLAAVRTGDVAYAAYRARHAPATVSDCWIAVSSENAISAYLRWPHENRSAQIAVLVNRPRSLRDLVVAGAGVAVLPCVVGDMDTRLERLEGEIPQLRHQQWLVMNNDDRHRREIRTVADRMIALLKGHEALIAGRRPQTDVPSQK